MNMDNKNRVAFTFNFSIGGFLRASDVDHHKSLRRLIETQGELFEFGFS